jgi:hypothetical protein
MILEFAGAKDEGPNPCRGRHSPFFVIGISANCIPR